MSKSDNGRAVCEIIKKIGEFIYLMKRVNKYGEKINRDNFDYFFIIIIAIML